MSLTAIIAGGAAALGVGSTYRANKADEAAAELASLQSIINAQKVAFDSAATQYNMTRQFGQMISQQQALASAMGKQSTSGSVKAMRADSARTLARDIKLLDERTNLAKKSAQVGIAYGDVATKTKQSARNLGLLSRGLGLASVML